MKNTDLEKARELKNDIEEVEWFLDIIERWQEMNEVGEPSSAMLKKTYTSKDIEVPPKLVLTFLSDLRNYYIEKQAGLENEFAEL